MHACSTASMFVGNSASAPVLHAIMFKLTAVLIAALLVTMRPFTSGRCFHEHTDREVIAWLCGLEEIQCLRLHGLLVRVFPRICAVQREGVYDPAATAVARGAYEQRLVEEASSQYDQASATAPVLPTPPFPPTPVATPPGTSQGPKRPPPPPVLGTADPSMPPPQSPPEKKAKTEARAASSQRSTMSWKPPPPPRPHPLDVPMNCMTQQESCKSKPCSRFDSRPGKGCRFHSHHHCAACHEQFKAKGYKGPAPEYGPFGRKKNGKGPAADVGNDDQAEGPGDESDDDPDLIS